MQLSSKPGQQAGITLRRLLLICLGAVLLVVLFYAEEDFTGSMAWSKFKRQQAADGEKLDAADFVPPTVPDEENFAMTPLLRVALDYVHTTNGIQWRDTNAWQHLSNIRIELYAPGITAPKITEAELGIPVDLKAFAQFYRGNNNYPQSAQPGSDAEIILTALGKFDADFKELREAAASRPLSRFPIEYNYKPPAEILLPHLAQIRGLTMVCSLRAIAELESRRSPEALADLELGLRLSDSIHYEPFLIDHLVRIGSLNVVLQGVREGLIRHAWSDAQLAELETNLAGIHLLQEYEHTMRGERALSVSGLDYMRREGFTSKVLNVPEESPATTRVYSWIPGGWYQRNMTLIGEYYRDYALPAIDATNSIVKPAMGDRMMRNLSGRKMGPYNIFAKMLLPALGKASQRTARAQTLLDETRVACAIERYRMQHNQLPDTLDELVPQFLPKIPNDLFDGRPLRYLKKADGTFLLYSIGWNEKDDGGVAAETNGNTPRANPNEGDWVWPSASGAK